MLTKKEPIFTIACASDRHDLCHGCRCDCHGHVSIPTTTAEDIEWNRKARK